MTNGPSEVSSKPKLHFNPGDLVLVRYSSFPYWPASVSPTHQERFKGKHFIKRRTRGGDLVPCFWCGFENEDSGGWVRADRMIAFHPALLDKIRVPKDNDWYKDQKQAIKSAVKSFQEKYKREENRIPKLTHDLEHCPHNGKWNATDNDDLITDDEIYPNFIDGKEAMDHESEREENDDRSSPRHSGRQSKGGKAILRKSKGWGESGSAPQHSSLPDGGTRPKKRTKPPSTAKNDLVRDSDNDCEEPRRKARRREIQEEIANWSSRKKRSCSFSDAFEPSKKVRKMEEELASANERIVNLKKTLKRTELKLSELTGGRAGLACVIPLLPSQVQEPSPESQKPRSIPMSSEKFKIMIDTLSSEYEAFESAASAADDARTELEKTIETVKKLYHEATSKVSIAEEKGTAMERYVVRKLRKILAADVQIQDLRERRAGKEICAMRKECKKLPAMHGFCSAISESWKKQVIAYMKEVEGAESKGDFESPTENKKTKQKSALNEVKDGEVKVEDKIKKEKKKTREWNPAENDICLDNSGS